MKPQFVHLHLHTHYSLLDGANQLSPLLNQVKTFGQPAVLTLGQASFDLTVIDNTRGITVDEAGSIGVQTIRPAADVRRSDMTRLGLAARDLVDGVIAFGDTAWIIKTVLEQGQELRLILIQSS